MHLLESVKRLQPFVAKEKDCRIAMTHVAFDRGAIVATDGRIMGIANRKTNFAGYKLPGVTDAVTGEELGSFPNWEKVLIDQSKVQTKVAFERQDLIEVLTFIVKLWKSFDKRGLMRKSSPFVVRIEKGEGETASFSLNGFASGATLNWDMWDGPGQVIAFNAEYLLKAIKAFTANSVTISIQDDIRACLVSSEEEEDLEVIVMPVNIRKD